MSLKLFGGWSVRWSHMWVSCDDPFYRHWEDEQIVQKSIFYGKIIFEREKKVTVHWECPDCSHILTSKEIDRMKECPKCGTSTDWFFIHTVKED